MTTSALIGRADFVRYATSASADGRKPLTFVDAVELWGAMSALQKHCGDFRSIIDIGQHRGGLADLLRHSFAQEFTYLATEPGFCDNDTTLAARLNERPVTREMEPGADKPDVQQAWPVKGADVALFLGGIEYLANPMPCLDAVNRALRAGGMLILMTGNLTSLRHAYQMLFWGRSPNIPPSRSGQWSEARWPAPLREFSAGELEFFFDMSGFRIAEHTYFQRESGAYRRSGGRFAAASLYTAFKEFPRDIVLRLVPHFCDRQLVIATKTESYEQVVNRRPRATSSMSEWLRICAEFEV